MTWSKALSFTHDGVGANYFDNVIEPYFTWMGGQPGIETWITNGGTSSSLAGIKYTSNRFGQTYDHGTVYLYNYNGNGTHSAYYWEEADRASNTLNVSGRRKRYDTYFQPPQYISEYEVWASDEHKSWFLFHKQANQTLVQIYGAFLDPDDLTQGAEAPAGYGYRETDVLTDQFACMGIQDETNSTTLSTLVPGSYVDQKSSSVLIRNYYAIFGTTYSINVTNYWPYQAKKDYGMIYIGLHNDMHCSGGESNNASVTQLDGDPNFYISTGGGAGLFLDCGTTSPAFFS